jgi:hypothetical protein
VRGGSQFLTTKMGTATMPPIRSFNTLRAYITLNWFEELKQRIPVD